MCIINILKCISSLCNVPALRTWLFHVFLYGKNSSIKSIQREGSSAMKGRQTFYVIRTTNHRVWIKKGTISVFFIVDSCINKTILFEFYFYNAYVEWVVRWLLFGFLLFCSNNIGSSYEHLVLITTNNFKSMWIWNYFLESKYE